MSAVEIAGRYRLESRLGFGGMSTVHLALDLRLERPVEKVLGFHGPVEPAIRHLVEHRIPGPGVPGLFQGGLIGGLLFRAA